MLHCDVCESLLDEEDLFCANCGTEASRRTATAAAPSGRLATCNFECSGCGASMSYDAGAAGLRCPFCGSVKLTEKKDAQVLAPSRVVPFQVDRDEATQSMRAWLRRGFWRPGDLAQRAAVVHMTPVYVPYWVFEADTHTYWTADTDRTPPGARGNWFPMSGENEGRYSGVLIGASGALAPSETAALAPFDLAAAALPEEVDLEHVTVEQFSLARKYARPLARQGIEAAESNACGDHVPSRVRNLHVNVQIRGMSSEPVLLPVWVMAYRFNQKVFRFLVNGQTGQATGQAPTSWGKIALAAAAAAVGIVIVALLAAWLASH